MRSVLFLGLSLFAFGCSGQVDTTAPDEHSPPLESTDRSRPSPPNAPERIADGIGTPSAIVLDGDRIVIATRTTRLDGEDVQTGAVFVADKRTGPALMIALEREVSAYEALATDGASAFVASADRRLLRVSLMGGDAALVANLDAHATALAVSGKYLYVATDAGDVGRVEKTGGDFEPLAKANGVRTLTADATAIYVAAQDGVTRIALDSREAKALATSAPCSMVQSGTRLFFTADGAVLRAATDGGDVATVASGRFAACAIAADETSLWFATTSGGLGMMRAPIAGGAPVTIDGASGARAVAVDATHVYWMTAEAVLRLAK